MRPGRAWVRLPVRQASHYHRLRLSWGRLHGDSAVSKRKLNREPDKVFSTGKRPLVRVVSFGFRPSGFGFLADAPCTERLRAGLGHLFFSALRMARNALH